METWDTFKHSLTTQNVHAMGKGLHVLGKFGGSETVSKFGDQIAEKAGEFDMGKPPSVPDYRQAETTEDYFKWAAGLLGTGVGSIIPIIAGSAAGAAAGGATPVPGGAAIGAVLGGMTPATLLNVGESYEFFKGEGISDQRAVEYAILTSPAVVGLDYFSAAKFLKGSEHETG